jgi:drug/metabolite transporter (DMT)-like permease
VAPRHVALLAALAAIWGASYLLIKIALDDMEPGFIVCARTALAAVVLYGVLRLSGGGADARAAVAEVRRRPAMALLLGFLAIALPFTLITFGELEVPSGLTAVLIAPASLFVALFARFFDESERIDRTQSAGLFVGLGGVALLVGVESVQTLGEFLGALAMIGAAACYALSSFVVKGGYGGTLSSTAISFVSVASGAVLTLPLAAATAPRDVPELGPLAALVVLSVAGTALAFVIFYKLITEAGAGNASLVSYLAPPVALAYGTAFRDEAITAAAIAGLVLILGGVALASRGGRGGTDTVVSHGPDACAGGAGVSRRGAELARAEPSGFRP